MTTNIAYAIKQPALLNRFTAKFFIDGFESHSLTNQVLNVKLDLKKKTITVELQTPNCDINFDIAVNILATKPYLNKHFELTHLTPTNEIARTYQYNDIVVKECFTEYDYAKADTAVVTIKFKYSDIMYITPIED
jgi:hypothetical protein